MIQSKQQIRNAVVILVNSIKKLFVANDYVMYIKQGGTCPMTKCPKCGRVRVAMGMRADNKGTEIKLLDICGGRFESGETSCNYYFKVAADTKKFKIPAFGNRSARILYHVEGNAAHVSDISTNDPNFIITRGKKSKK